MDDRKQPPSGHIPHEKLPTDKEEPSSESANDAAGVITTEVDDKTILFGRGKACNNHPANKRMRLLIDNYKEKYLTSGRGEKKMIVLKVHRQLVEEGMRFLKQEDGIDGWIEAEPAEAITKVGHAIRCNRKGPKRKNDGDSDGPSQAAKSSAPVVSAVPGHMPEDILAGVARGDIAASLALANLPNAANPGLFPSSGPLGNLLGSTFPVGTNPLLASLGSAPARLNEFSPPFAGSMGLAAQPSLQQSLALSGLSAMDIYILMERERQLQQAMLYDQIMRNQDQR